MAIAGRVAIVPKGEWSQSVTYDKLDLVTHNGNTFIAYKSSVGVEPVDGDTWMLVMQGIDPQDIENIIDGTTPVAKAKDADTVDGLHANEIADGTNLLINPDFKNPVNTSGNTSWTIGTTATAVFDTWYGARGIFDLSSDGIRITMDGTNLNPFIQNRISKGNLAGKEVTFSAEVDGVVYSVNLTVPTTVSESDYSEHFENGLHFGVGLTSTQVWCTILNDGSAEQFTVAWAKLELGKQATPFVPPNAEVEKLKCGKADYLPLTGGKLSAGIRIVKNGGSDYAFQNTVVERGTTPTSKQYHSMPIFDVNNNLIGSWQYLLSTDNYSQIYMRAYQNTEAQSYATLGVQALPDGTFRPFYAENADALKTLFHTGNKPTGTYTGNGSATSRTINTGGIGNVIFLKSASSNLGFFSRNGGVMYNLQSKTFEYFYEDKMYFRDGNLYIATDSSLVNYNGSVFTYYVV